MKKLTLLLTISLIGLFSCAKKDTTPTPTPTDVRDKIAGNYNLTDSTWVTWSSDTSLHKNDTIEVSTSTLVISKNSSTSDRIDFSETDKSGTIKYYGNAVNNASNGTTFNIPKQDIISGTDTFTWTGNTSFTLGSSKFDGAYNSDTKILGLGYSGNLHTTVNGTHLNIPARGVKTAKRQ